MRQCAGTLQAIQAVHPVIAAAYLAIRLVEHSTHPASQAALKSPARELNTLVPYPRQRAPSVASLITADTAVRLGLFFRVEARFWLNLQTEFDMRVAVRTLQDKIAPRFRSLTPQS
jgi:antitoxin HigA-1